MAEAKIALHVLNAGLVLDRSVFVGQTVAEMQATLYQLRNTLKKGFTVIENANSFFTAANMLALIKADDNAYKLIAEKAGVTLRDDVVQSIKSAEIAIKAINDSMVAPLPPYPFSAVPADFDVTKKFELCNNGQSFRRVGGGATKLSLLQGELIWRYLSASWAVGRVPEAKYFRDNRVSKHMDDQYRVGCQYVQRYEVEQIAVWRGWKFPTQK